jgi:hypothetical protein
MMMLFFGTEGDVSATSGDKTIGPGQSNYDGGGIKQQISDLKTAIQTFVISSDIQGVFENANKALISMNDSAKSLQRTMGGPVRETDKFRETLYKAYSDTMDIGSSFKDVTDAVEGLAGAFNRIVQPSSDSLRRMVEFSKATGIATKDIGTMAAEMMRFGVTEEQAVEQMKKVADTARASGLNAKSLVTEVGKNLKSMSGFGFKSGIDGLTKMAKQAQLLRTSIESIGAKKLANDVLDPEKAIEIAASFQMMGGAVGKLADPFQLLHMAQTDINAIQEELVKSTASAFKFNKETGNFDIATQDMYRLREQAALTGANLEDLVNTGREAAKIDMLKGIGGVDKLSEDQQGLIAGLAKIGPGGTVSIDLPGFDEIDKSTGEVRDLATLMKDGKFTEALEQYQKDAAKSDKDLAIEQMTIQETQAKDVNIIKEAVLRSFDPGERDKLLADIEKSITESGKVGKATAETGAKTVKEPLKTYDAAAANMADILTPTAQQMLDYEKLLKDANKQKAGEKDYIPVQDAFFPSGGAPQIMSKGAIYKGVIGDEVALGTGLSDILNSKTNLTDTISKGTQTIGGALDINVNVGGRVDGDKNMDISKIFSSPIFQKQLMDMVLYKMKDYQKQQGVL